MSDTYKGIIKGIPAAESNIYKVRIPFLEDNTGTEMIYDAMLSHTPGFKDEYNVGDVVFVTFENNIMKYAVILGKLYTVDGSGSSSISAAGLKVENYAVLPEDTKIGKYSTKDLFILYNKETSNGGGTWGSITGTLSDQTDLQDALDEKSTVEGTDDGTNWTSITIDETTKSIPSGVSPADLLQYIYPVGSIYMSVNNVSPATFLGGAWESIQDRFLLSAGNTYQPGTTGGSATHTPSGTVGGHALTTSEMPSHTHTFTGSAATSGNNSVGHTHTVTDAYANTTSGSTALTIAQIPSHQHFLDTCNRGSGSNVAWSAYYGMSGGTHWTTYYGSSSVGGGEGHTHSISNTSTTRTTSGISANHTHSVTAKGSNSNTGGGESHNHGFTGASMDTMPPYLTVYMWRRTA